MSPRRRRSRTSASQAVKPGLVLFADTWPDWEHQGAPAPHPVIIIKAIDNTRVMLLPISTKRLGKAVVSLSRTDYPTIFANDQPLSDDHSAIVIADKFGDRCNVWGQLIGDLLHIGTACIRVRNGKQLSDAEWNHLKDRIKKAAQKLS